MKLTKKCQAAFAAHVLAEFPREACGIVVQGRYKRCKNLHEHPHANFALDSALFVKYDVQAVLHSHPHILGQAAHWPVVWPSGSDVQGHIDTNVPWGIAETDGDNVSELVWMDDSERAELVGRPFVSGVWDCYGVVRDWFWKERGIDIPNFARGMDWWLKKDASGKQYDLFSENFEKAGFFEIAMNEVQVGDCYLFKAASRVVNHCAVITGPNEILHHCYMRGGDALSRYDSAGDWVSMVVKAVRFVGGKDDNSPT